MKNGKLNVIFGRVYCIRHLPDKHQQQSQHAHTLLRNKAGSAEYEIFTPTCAPPDDDLDTSARAVGADANLSAKLSE